MENQTPILCNTKFFAYRVFFSIAAVVVAADQLFYDKSPGVSVGIFSLILGALLWLNRPATDGPLTFVWVGVLLAGPILQAGIETGFSNVLILGSVLVVLMGEISYAAIHPRWARWTEAVFAILKAPGRWPWVLNLSGRSTHTTDDSLPKKMGFLTWGVKVLAPAFFVILPFVLLLAYGNVILGQWMEQAMRHIEAWLLSLEFPSFGRVAFWIVTATLGMGFLYPAAQSVSRRFWQPRPPTITPAASTRLNYWRCVVILVAVNAVFLAANTVDALYLWSRTDLPPGVSHSRFVHEGVYNLIATVLLSAVVLVVIFEKIPSAAGALSVKTWSLVWVVQNLLLVGSIFLRLKLYVDAYLLSTRRIYVGCFLLLVFVGFLLLAGYILRRKPFRWLLLTNTAATFALFYAIQFADVNGWVGHFNVTCWEEKREGVFDPEYLASLGPPAWPALLRVARHPDPTPERQVARARLQTALVDERIRAVRESWPSWQERRSRLAKLVSEELQTIQEKEP